MFMYLAICVMDKLLKMMGTGFLIVAKYLKSKQTKRLIAISTIINLEVIVSYLIGRYNEIVLTTHKAISDQDNLYVNELT